MYAQKTEKLSTAIIVDNVDNLIKCGKIKVLWQKISTGFWRIKIPKKLWIMWITYLLSRFSPTFTISPAPIVINMSPWIEFFIKKSSISANAGK